MKTRCQGHPAPEQNLVIWILVVVIRIGRSSKLERNGAIVLSPFRMAVHETNGRSMLRLVCSVLSGQTNGCPICLSCPVNRGFLLWPMLIMEQTVASVRGAPCTGRAHDVPEDALRRRTESLRELSRLQLSSGWGISPWANLRLRVTGVVVRGQG